MLKLILFFILTLSVSFADIKVIVHADVPALSLTAKQVKNIFLARVKSLPNGRNIQLLDQQNTNYMYKMFYKEVAHKSALKMTKYWVKLSFTGRGERPKVVSSNKEVYRAIRNNHRLISYVSDEYIPDDMKVLFIISSEN